MDAIFRDTGQSLYDFARTFLVRCPRCSQCARVMLLTRDEETFLTSDQQGGSFNSFTIAFHDRKLSCFYCGYTATWKGKSIRIGGPRDWYFLRPLWLQVPCCGKILWAYNEEHLQFLESYVAAKLRVKAVAGASPVRNKTLASSLPGWMKSAKNREEVLKGIQRLKKLLV